MDDEERTEETTGTLHQNYPNPFMLYTKIIQKKKPPELSKKRDSSEEGGDERKRCLFGIKF